MQRVNAIQSKPRLFDSEFDSKDEDYCIKSLLVRLQLIYDIFAKINKNITLIRE